MCGNTLIELGADFADGAERCARILKDQGIISDVDAFMDVVEQMGATMQMKRT